jgi:hypothetical protein
VKIRTEKKSLEMRAILGKNLKEPPILQHAFFYKFQTKYQPTSHISSRLCRI